MGDELDAAEAQAGWDMGYCTRCGGYDYECSNQFHESNPRARHVPDPEELPGLGSMLNRLAYGPNPPKDNA